MFYKCGLSTGGGFELKGEIFETEDEVVLLTLVAGVDNLNIV